MLALKVYLDYSNYCWIVIKAEIKDMQLISQNPYRVIGIAANASAREITRRQNKIKAYTRVGKEITSEYDFDFLPTLNRNADSIQQAFAQIQHNQNKLNHSLFWFLNETPIDEIAIQHLKKGDKDKAIEIWGKIFESHSLNSNNFSSFNNLSTLYLLDNHIDKRRRGIAMKSELIMSDVFTNFSHKVADISFNTDNSKQLDIFIALIFGINPKATIKQKADLFLSAHKVIRLAVSKKLSAQPIYEIESSVEETKRNRTGDPSNAYKYGKQLFQKTKGSVSDLKTLLGITDLTYQLHVENIAKELLQCSIDYFNKKQELNSSENYLEKAAELVLKAQLIAVNPITKDRVRDNLKTLGEMKDREINEAIEFLAMVKNLYEENERKIRAQVRSEEATLPYGVTIDWNKVNNAIENSLDWDKVVSAIKEIIPPGNIDKIKNHTDKNKIAEFRRLFTFLSSKLTFYLKEKVRYSEYWKDERITTGDNRETMRQIMKKQEEEHMKEQLQKAFAPPESEPMPYWLKYILAMVGFMIIFALLSTC